MSSIIPITLLALLNAYMHCCEHFISDDTATILQTLWLHLRCTCFSYIKSITAHCTLELLLSVCPVCVYWIKTAWHYACRLAETKEWHSRSSGLVNASTTVIEEMYSAGLCLCEVACEVQDCIWNWQAFTNAKLATKWYTEMMQTKYGYYRQLVGLPSSAIYMTFGVTSRVAKPFKCNFLWHPFCLTTAAAMRSVWVT